VKTVPAPRKFLAELLEEAPQTGQTFDDSHRADDERIFRIVGQEALYISRTERLEVPVKHFFRGS
jgi:hypothetical protein